MFPALERLDDVEEFSFRLRLGEDRSREVIRDLGRFRAAFSTESSGDFDGR